jgi:DNA polymerase-3 subunit delta
MLSLKNEAAKLAAYKGFSGAITADDVDELCTKSTETNIFKLTDAAAKGDVKTAVSVYESILAAKVSPFVALSMLARQFALVLRVKYMMKQGMSSDAAAKEIGVKPYAATVAARQAARFTFKALIAALNECVRVEAAAKSGRLDAEIGVERILYTL